MANYTAADVKRLFGADNAWDVVEDVLRRYFNERVVTSPRQRMAIAGRNLLRWLGQSHILESSRSEFEALLIDVAEDAEEWLTSAQSMGVAERGGRERVLPWDRRPAAVAASRPPSRKAKSGAEREVEMEFEL